MELAKVEVRLGGSLANTVMRDNVTPAELSILRRLHGDDCIGSIQWQGKKPMKHEDEIDRLRQFYNTENSRKLIDQLFPGVTPTLPITFKEVGYNVTEEGAIEARGQLQKKYEDELIEKMKNATVERGGDPNSVQVVNY